MAGIIPTRLKPLVNLRLLQINYSAPFLSHAYLKG